MKHRSQSNNLWGKKTDKNCICIETERPKQFLPKVQANNV